MRLKSVMIPVLVTAVLLAALTPAAQAQTQPSIPINGRYTLLTIRIYIPPTPKWAHDVVLNATIAWNNAQSWNQENQSIIYQFVESDETTATSTIKFSMPAPYASIAVGWTNYKFASGSRTTYVSTETYLTPTIFNNANAGNATAGRYAFWLALHELGRILGLGSVLDPKDIMDPMYTPLRMSQVPNLSTLDLYAIHTLAQGSAPTFVTLPDGIQDQLTPATTFLP